VIFRPSRAGTLLSLVSVLAGAACGAEVTGPDSRFPAAAEHGIDAKVLEGAYHRARETPGILSLLVQRNGVLVGEEYFNGSSADSLDQVWSVTKSVTSILTGIALEEGYLTSLDQTLADLLGQVADSIPADKGRITVRNLLTMTTGLEWHELDGGGEYNQWVTSGNMIQYAVDLPWRDAPGQTFHYNTAATHLLAVAVAEATGVPLLDFAREHLFGPLGIDDVEWWTDERGYYTGGMGVYLHPRDMLKLGELYLHHGVWLGSQVVSRDWVAESTDAQVSTGGAVPFGDDYGYLWWVGQSGGRAFYFANGYAGQFIFVTPSLDLVVVATSNWSGLTWASASAQWEDVIGLIVDGVLPSVRP
jgi:CubicO group peptidase (beta-lactamase class C family)